jgi:O-antigen/teichoic acid export membrane protein
LKQIVAMSIPANSVDLTRAFRRGFAATFALDLVTKVLGAVTVVVLIRDLSVSSYAYTTLFLTFAQLAGSAASSGVRTRYLREEAERISRATGEGSGGAFFNALLRATLLIIAVGICLAPVAGAIGFGSSDGGGPKLIFFATAFAIGFSAAELAIAHFQANRRFFTAGMLSIIRALGLLGASLAVTVGSGSSLAISLPFITVMLLVGTLTAGPIARRSILSYGGLPRLTWFNREEMWLSFYYVAAAGFAYVDVMVAGALLSEHQVATLGATLRYLAIALGAIPALGAVLRVRTSQVDIVDSPAEQEAMVLGWIRRAALPAGFVMGLGVLLAPVVIPQIDGGRYPGSIEAFQIFLVTAFSAYLAAPAASVLMAQRRYVTLASIFSVGLFLNFVGDVAVAQQFGVIGIAIVSSAVFVAIDAVVVLSSVRYALRPKSRA